jgi:replication factor A1
MARADLPVRPYYETSVPAYRGWRVVQVDMRVTNANIRYILQMNLMDHTGQFWITAFNEVAEQLMGISANDLQRMKDTDENQFSKAFQDCMGKTFTFQMMAKQDSYNVSLPARRLGNRKRI